jgi:hypothetical protein
LSTFAIVLVLAGELLVLEAIQYFSNGFGRLGKHGLEWHTCHVRESQVA